MEINATLFVQMFNFIIAYILIDRIIVRLATAIVQAEDRKLGTLESEVAEQEKRIAGRVRYNEDDWVILQKRLQSECPHVTVGQNVHAPYEAPPSLPHSSQRDVEHLVEPLKNSLISAVMTMKDMND